MAIETFIQLRKIRQRLDEQNKLQKQEIELLKEIKSLLNNNISGNM